MALMLETLFHGDFLEFVIWDLYFVLICFGFRISNLQLVYGYTLSCTIVSLSSSGVLHITLSI